MTDRRTFLKQAGVFAASLPLGAALLPQAVANSTPGDPWTGLKQLFNQDPDYLHFSNFLMASHPKPVREAIERYRTQIDRNPGLTMDWDRQETWKREGEVREWAGRYLKIELVTPRNPELAAGFTFFRVKGQDSDAVAAHMMKNRAVIDAVDRDVGPVIRTAPGLLNTSDNIQRIMTLLGQRV